MDEQLTQLAATVERLATAAEALERALGRLEAQHESIHSQVDRIIAAIDERGAEHHVASENLASDLQQLQERTTQLERENADLKAQAGRLARKTLPPLVSALLTKSCGINDADSAAKLDSAALDKALGSLSLEQRIAVKAEMARAGMIE
ncbi:MAG: hypothetical protein ACE14M_00305 [Terriglobales bacterium]